MGFWVLGLRFGVLGFWVLDLGFRVGFEVQRLEFWVWVWAATYRVYTA